LVTCALAKEEYAYETQGQKVTQGDQSQPNEKKKLYGLTIQNTKILTFFIIIRRESNST
jgi:hypothetical protein